MASFLGEIKRRKVFQVAAVYIVVAWLIIQVIDVVVEPLSLPDWLDTVVIVLLIAGFPIALVLAWALDLTPQGVVRTTPSDTQAGKGNDTKEPTSLGIATLEHDLLPNSVAVLPLENLSPNPNDAYFAAGMHEEILNHLAKLRDVSVIARTSVMQYAGVARPISEIASELNVGTVMEGSVRYSGDRVRVTAQLIEGTTGIHLWTESYDRELSDIFSIQTDIATQIAGALKAKLSTEERETIAEQPTTSTEAYGLYLRAVAQHGGFAGNPTALPSLRVSIQSYLDRAIHLDSEFALAHAWKAYAYIGSRQNDPVPVGEWEERKAELERLIIEHAEKALVLDPRVGLAHTVLAIVHFYNWHAAEAERAFDLALEVAPNDALTLFWYSGFQASRERYEDAERLAKRATVLNPKGQQPYLFLGYSLWKQGRLDDAAEAFGQGIAVNPQDPLAYIFAAGLETARGERESALKVLRTGDRLMLGGSSPGIRAHTAWNYGRLGETADAQRIFNEVKEMAVTRYIGPTVWAWAYLAIGEHQRALELYKEAQGDVSLVQDPWSLIYAAQNFCSDPVLEEPRFREVFSNLWLTELD